MGWSWSRRVAALPNETASARLGLRAGCRYNRLDHVALVARARDLVLIAQLVPGGQPAMEASRCDRRQARRRHADVAGALRAVVRVERLERVIDGSREAFEAGGHRAELDGPLMTG